MKKEIPCPKGNQKSQRNDIDLEARKTKRKSIRDIYLRHQYQAHLKTILMRVNIQTMRPRKVQIPDMAQYANVNFDTYIKEADLIKAALIKNPIPENISSVKTLDDFEKDILKNKKNQKDLDFDNVLEKIEGGNRSVMDPLSNIWTAIESARLPHKDSVEVDVKEIQEYVEQAVLLLGQASNSIFYYRRFYMLLVLTNSSQQHKQMMRKDSELLQKNDNNLFGKSSIKISGTAPNKKKTP